MATPSCNAVIVASTSTPSDADVVLINMPAQPGQRSSAGSVLAYVSSAVIWMSFR